MFNSESLGVLAAKAVTLYLTKQIPLTDSVISISREENLNLEQTKRLVEATNQVAYLKILETAKDRTFNFDVASVDDVLAGISTPDISLGKEASFGGYKPAPLQLMFESSGIEKKASFTADDVNIDLVPYLPALVQSYKETIRNGELTKVACAEKIVKLVESVKQEPYLLSKVAFAKTKNEKDILGLVQEVGVLEKAANGFLTFNKLELSKIAELDETISELKSINERITKAHESLEKVSFMAISGRLAGSIYGRKATGITGTSIWRNATAAGSNAIKPTGVVRGYQGYPGMMAKSASAPAGTSGAGLPSPSEGFKENFKKSLLYKVIPKNRTWTQRLGGATTVADYAFMRETIAPKHSVWDSLHRTGE